ncbi:hypothetical protein JXA32_00475, partial [Candidatus Sumerlaeota bacterium]|nr:hypothetical protein [Candidatus Sumerlaeota bacterium]
RNYQSPALDELREVPLSWQIILFYCYFPACAAVVVFRQGIARAANSFWQSVRVTKPSRKTGKDRKRDKKQKKVSHEESVVEQSSAFNWRRWTAGTILLLTLPAAIGLYTLDRNTKTLSKIQYCSEHQMWNDVLVNARRLPLSLYLSSYVNHDVNLALYHTGQMPYEMFLYPQTKPYWAIFEFNDLPVQQIIKPCDLYLELGRVGEAEHMAMELLDMQPTGGALKRMALVKMIKGQIPAATVFLNVLQDDMVWGRWAQEYLQRLAKDPELSSDPEIQRIRGLMITEDDLEQTTIYFPDGSKSNYVAMLHNQLEQNGRNQMAFEYYMAQCLVIGNLKNVVDAFPLLDNFSYPSIPPVYEEAAMIYGSVTQGEIEERPSGVFFRDYKISEPTLARCQSFMEILRRYDGFNKKAEPEIARAVGGSYFHYFYLMKCGDAR